MIRRKSKGSRAARQCRPVEAGPAFSTNDAIKQRRLFDAAKGSLLLFV